MMPASDAMWVAIPLIVAQLANIVVSLINGKKATAIAQSVNGAASVSREEIRALRQEVEQMRHDKAEKKETAALLAQTHASKGDAP
jgi:hypothetical protein